MKQRMKKWLAVFSVFVLVLQMGGGTVCAAAISGDKGDLSITSDANYLYFSYEGSWVSYLSERIQVATDGTGLGALAALSFSASNEGDSGKITVTDAWGTSILGASGSVTNSDKKESYGYENMKWSVKVPLSTYASLDAGNMTFTWGGKSVTLKVKEEVTEAPATEEVTEAVTEEITTEGVTTEEITTEESTGNNTEETATEADPSETTEISTIETTEFEPEAITTEDSGSIDIDIEDDIIVSGGVQIDGMYSDWDDLPKTPLKYDDYTSHYGQMFTDGEYIYAHFQASSKYTTHINMGLWYLTINDQTFTLRILQEKNGIVAGTESPWQKGVYTDRKVFFGYENNKECDSKVVLTLYDTGNGNEGPGDDIEFSFSLEKIAEYTGIPVDQMGTITLSNPNLGDKGVTIAGSSTGPLAGVMVAFILALAFFKKEKEMKEV